MKKNIVPRIVLCLLFGAGLFPLLFGQAETYRGNVIDAAGNRYTLTDLTISGTTRVHCILQDTFFTVGFDRLRSVTFTPENTESPFQGYVRANLVTTGGTQTALYVNRENYVVQGVEENLGVKIRIPFTEVQTLEVLPPEQAQPGAS
ncbi:MAG TPA: hypothetical protein ENN69_01895 [Spirochaetia bacterium]|nr:hypothetical protein [Spirochaetia bacterium]